jgi:hypothetical protein
MCTLWALVKAVGSSKNWIWLLVAAGLVATATFFRFAGVFLIPVVGVTAFLNSETLLITRQRAVRALVAGLASSIGLALTTARNAMHGFAPLGERYPGGRSVPVIIEQSLTVVGTYINPLSEGMVALGIGLIQVGLVIWGAVLAFRTRATQVLVILASVVAYWLFLAWSEATAPIDPITLRLTVPILAPAVIGTVFSLRFIARTISRALPSKAGPYVGMTMVTGTAISCLVVNVAVGGAFTTSISSRSQGYNRTKFTASPLAAAVDHDVCQAGLASSNPWLTYWVSGCVGVLPIPTRSGGGAHKAERDNLYSALHTGTIRYLAFFNDRPSLSPRDVRERGIQLKRVARVRDGELYRVVNR